MAARQKNWMISQDSFLFNEAEADYDEAAKEPTVEDVIDPSRKAVRKPKRKGQREEDLKDFPQEVIPHDIPEQELNEAFGEGNWKSMPDEVFGSFVSNRPNGLRKNTS